MSVVVNKVRSMKAEPQEQPSLADGLMLGKYPNLCKHLYLSSKISMVDGSMDKGCGSDKSFF